MTPDEGPGALDVARLRGDVARALEEPPDAIGDADDLFDRGLDSIRLMSLVEQWRAEGADVSFIELAETPTLTAWAGLLAGH